MKLENYEKFHGTVLFFHGTPNTKPITSEVFSDRHQLVNHISEVVGSSLRKTDIAKLTVNVRVHSAKFCVDFIPYLYATGWEKTHYSTVLKGQLIPCMEIYLNYWTDPEYAVKKSGQTEIEKLVVGYDL